MATSRRRLSFSTPLVDVPEETGKICSLCLAPHTELSEPSSWKNLQAQKIYSSDTIQRRVVCVDHAVMTSAGL